MRTTIKNWCIIDVYENSELNDYLGRAIYGVVLKDEQGRFEVDDYVCTAGIVEIDYSEAVAITKSGEYFMLDGIGSNAKVDQSEFALIAKGIRPEKLASIKHKLKLDRGLPDPIVGFDELFNEVEANNGKFEGID